MIRIKRPDKVPASLAKHAPVARKALEEQHAKGEKLTIDAAIYGAKSVKNALIAAQRKKCCFCESFVTHVASGHVEHFRPKGGYRDTKAGSLFTPGYFWLAYAWENLLFCCEVCNSRHKGNHFPLRQPAARAVSPSHDLAAEEPMFIDPAAEDPEDHIGYREEYPFAVNGSPRGQATWEALGLDREDLAERRREFLKIVKALLVIRSDYPESKEATVLLTDFAKEGSQWSAMVRAAIRDYQQPA